MPFMDMVSNRFTLFSYNALLFVFNQLFKRVEATIVVPVLQTFWTLVSVVGGFVFYKEYRDLQMLQLIGRGASGFVRRAVHLPTGSMKAARCATRAPTPR